LDRLCHHFCLFLFPGTLWRSVLMDQMEAYVVDGVEDVKLPPVLRRMIPIPETSHFEDKVQQELRIMSYNMLAQQLIKRNLFSFCSNRSLKWNYRSEKLVEQIVSYNADIVCLQVRSSSFK